MCDGGYSIYAPPSWPQRISGSWKPPKEDLDEDPEAKKWLVRTYRSEKTECQAVVNTSSAAASSNTSLDCDEESMYSPWAFHSMPYATRGYYRLEMSVEGVIERCSPAPKGDTDRLAFERRVAYLLDPRGLNTFDEQHLPFAFFGDVGGVDLCNSRVDLLGVHLRPACKSPCRSGLPINF